ncbi:MAG TPA: lysine 2,3-aminomutase, partial [Hyphomicrobiaceae bacterium]|nr:lysine 2,3-aminomutase [Hyphomicrobiaceae bacterium]
MITNSRSTLRTITDLEREGLVPASAAQRLDRVAKRYAVAVTPAMAALIEATNPADPIARQFIPDPRELDLASV